MRSSILLLAASALIIGSPAFSGSHEASGKKGLKPTSAVHQDAQQTYQDIKNTLGIVPDFLKRYPEASISGAWQEMKAVQLSANTAIPGKYKELIGLAVSAQAPCRYCTYFHTEAAKLNGATQQEIREAVAQASLTRHWSTFASGLLLEEPAFRKEVDEMLSFSKRKSTAELTDEEKASAGREAGTAAVQTPETAKPGSADAAYKEMEQMYGKVPSFMKPFPKEGVAAAWSAFKNLEENADTAIPPKYKNLVSLAVAAQVPCRMCIYFDTQAAKMNGATEREINEALAIASITRQWSTVLNGMQINEPTFRTQTDQIMKHLKAQMVPRKPLAGEAAPGAVTDTSEKDE